MGTERCCQGPAYCSHSTLHPSKHIAQLEYAWLYATVCACPRIEILCPPLVPGRQVVPSLAAFCSSPAGGRQPLLFETDFRFVSKVASATTTNRAPSPLGQYREIVARPHRPLCQESLEDDDTQAVWVDRSNLSPHPRSQEQPVAPTPAGFAIGEEGGCHRTSIGNEHPLQSPYARAL